MMLYKTKEEIKELLTEKLEWASRYVDLEGEIEELAEELCDDEV